MNVVVVQFEFDIAIALQYELGDVCIVPTGSGMMKYPCMLPVTPSSTVPGVPPGSHPPGLSWIPGPVSKLPFLNCCTTVIIPVELVRTVKCRSKVSVAQSFPQGGPETGPQLPPK